MKRIAAILLAWTELIVACSFAGGLICLLGWILAR